MAAKWVLLAFCPLFDQPVSGQACTATDTTGCVDDVNLLQLESPMQKQEKRNSAHVGERVMMHHGLVGNRYASILSRSERASQWPNLFKQRNCTDAHGEVGSLRCLDVNGRSCDLCGQPDPVQFPEYADGFVVRDDCGNESMSSDIDRPLVSYNRPASANFLPPKTGAPSTWTNAWCELNLQKSCADADANRDYFYYPASFVVPPGFNYDFYYCKHNGYLEEEFVKNMRDYDRLYEQAAAVCAARDREFNVSSITHSSFLETYRPDQGPPSSYQARFLGAWTCAMGGPGGDIAYCAYTYKQLGEDSFCQYPSGPGFKGTYFEGTEIANKWECPK